MKANEFVKLRGISYCKDLLIKADGCAAIQAREDNSRVSVDDLRRLVESHELVCDCGGLQSVKDTFSFAWSHGADELTEYGERLKKAIADVESCQ